MVVGIGYRKKTTKWCSSCALPEAAAATRIYKIAIFRPPRCTASEQFVSQRTEVKIIQSSPLSLFPRGFSLRCDAESSVVIAATRVT